ncbi:MAG: hypothetical protein ACC652_01975, partial [Acidimicrobiales bacterium]
MCSPEASAPRQVEALWIDNASCVDWDELSHLYLIAPLGTKSASAVATVFENSKFKTFVYRDDQLIGAGRALADGL